MPRLPLTIWTHTLLELLKRFTVAALVLVTVLSFAITVQPLSEGTLGTLEALRFMLLATIPMSAYALPFAGGFAATLVYHRMAQDNELLAAYAGGIGHTKLLVPAGCFGLILTLGLLAINDQAIPRFLRTMEQMVTQDIARVMSTRLSAGETVRIDNVMVHARDVRRIEDDDGSGARDLMLLSEPAFLELDLNGNVSWDATAKRAWVWFFEGDNDSTRVVVRPEQVAVITGESRAELSDIEKSFVVQGGFGDDPKFMTIAQMQQAGADPDRVTMLGTSRGRLAHWLAVDYLSVEARELFESGEALTLLDRNQRQVRIFGGGISDAGPELELLPRPGGGVLVERVRDGGTDRFLAGGARLVVDPSRAESARLPEYTLELTGVRVIDDQGEPLPGDREARTLAPLAAPPGLVEPVTSQPSIVMLERAEQRVAENPGANYFEWSTGELRRVYEKMLREILSKTHDRLALASLGLVMALSGAVTAIFLRDGLPLQVYLASFFPSLGAVLMISLGQQQTHGSGSMGLIVLWGGAVLVLAGTFAVLSIVRRH